MEKKRISTDAYDINKQTIYIALKSKIESRAHYAPEPERGFPTMKHHKEIIDLGNILLTG